MEAERRIKIGQLCTLLGEKKAITEVTELLKARTINVDVEIDKLRGTIGKMTQDEMFSLVLDELPPGFGD